MRSPPCFSIWMKPSRRDDVMHPLTELWQTVSRREFLRRSGFCLGATALADLLTRESRAVESKKTTDSLAARLPHFPAKVKRVIYLHMVGAPSQLDLFDPKPELVRHNAELCPKEFIE